MGERDTQAIESASIIVEGRADAPAVLLCEHASERLPRPWRWPESDVRLLGTHWAYDLGAAELTRELAAALAAPAVLANFSRLLVDANRAEDSDTLFRGHADGIAIELNRAVDAAERERRLASAHRAYHDAADRVVAACAAPVVFSIHTFTSEYEGERRPMEIGILFDAEEALAEIMAGAMRAAGFVTAMNEPWSGRGGLIYSTERHAGAHGRRPIEIEVRQDLATDGAQRARVVVALVGLFVGLASDAGL